MHTLTSPSSWLSPYNAVFFPSTGRGRVGHGAPDVVPDVVVEIGEADLQALLCRELRPLGAYMSGRLKVKGDLAVAMKLEAVLRALK